MRDIARTHGALEAIRQTLRDGRSRTARCPSHNDSNPSLSISKGDDGRLLLHCHAGCSYTAIAAELERRGLHVAELGPVEYAHARDGRPPRATASRRRPAGTRKGGSGTPTANGTPPHPYASLEAAANALERIHGGPATVYRYEDASGRTVGAAVRVDLPDGSKQIRPVMTSDGASYLAAMAEPRPLYRVPELATAPVVIVTEGEKAADAARSLGFTVTTSSGGCEAARKSDWTPLAGKHVWILPDHDQAGRKYATEVADTLCRLEPPAIVRVIELPDLPAKGDIVDWIEAHGDAAEPDAMRAELERLGAAAPAWELEEELEPEDLGFRPFPVEALPPAIARITTHVARAIGCDPSFVALPLLTVLGAAIGHTRRLRIKRGWTVPAIIWSVIIGESGTKKTPPFDWVMEPVRRLEKEAHARSVLERKRYEAELECWEREKAAWKSSKSTADPPEKPEPPPALRYLVSDVTLEALAGILRDNPRGVLLAVEELAGWTGSFGRYHTNGTNEQALWLPLYNAMPLFCDRKTGPPGERRIMVPRAGVWIAGTTQPGTLRRILTTEHREAGLAARLLLAWPPRTVKDWSEADVDPELEAELAGIVERLYALHQEPQRDGEPGPLVIEMTPDAKNVYKEFYRRHTREQVALEGDLAAAFSKLEEVAARLALIHHYACVAGDPTRDDPRVVDAASMRAGVTYADWFKHEACRVNELFVESTEDEERRRLVDWIIATGGAVTARDAQRGLRRLRAPGAAEEALEALVAAELGAWTPIPTTERGGQPTRLFTLNRKGSNAAG